MPLPRLRFPEMKLGLQPPGLCLFSERRGPGRPGALLTLRPRRIKQEKRLPSAWTHSDPKPLWQRAAAFRYDGKLMARLLLIFRSSVRS